MKLHPKAMPNSRGQALVETALILPLLIILVLNVINFGYCFLVSLNLSAAPRSGVLYSIMGFSTPGTLTLPAAGPPGTNTTVSNLTYQDITGALSNPGGTSSTTTQIQVCSTSIGVASAGTSSCVTCSGGTCNAGSSIASPGADPEPASFYLQRVDIQYQFKPLISGFPFGALLPSACTGSSGNVTCTFTRHVSMRAMN
jgi:hypothetical protein